MVRLKIDLLGGVLLLMSASICATDQVYADRCYKCQISCERQQCESTSSQPGAAPTEAPAEETTALATDRPCNPPECKMPDVIVVPCPNNCPQPVEIKPEESTTAAPVKPCVHVVSQLTQICTQQLVPGECGSCNYVAFCVLQHTCHQRCASSTTVRVSISVGSACNQRAASSLDMSQFTCPNLVSGRLSQYDTSQSKWKKFGIPIGISALVIVLVFGVVLFFICRKRPNKTSGGHNKNKRGTDKDSDSSSGQKGHKKGSAKPSHGSGHKKPSTSTGTGSGSGSGQNKKKRPSKKK